MAAGHVSENAPLKLDGHSTNTDNFHALVLSHLSSVLFRGGVN